MTPPALQDGALRPDLAVISEWVEPGCRILDLGCGDGALLDHLARTRNVRGYGLEIDPAKLAACIARGVNVIQADVDDGLKDFGTDSFDYVVLTQTLQALVRPDHALTEILRVGRRAIVTFPNFGHWRVRAQMLRGRMPLTPALPDAWYDSPNIHLCTVRDFEDLCRRNHWACLKRSLLDRAHHRGASIGLMPNLMAELALYMLEDDN
ncbi:MAG: methionine biosynthesis protein MetW [Panacagrimonas sp.]